MEIGRLLEKAIGQSDDEVLGMILSNRIDMGGPSGGFISGKQFPALIEDIKIWRAARELPATVECSPALNRELLLDNLPLLADHTQASIEAFGNVWAAGLARDALQLLEAYDGVLRGLAFTLSAGGYNSAGLIDPKTADDKIRWGIDYLVDVERKRAAVAAKSDVDVPPAPPVVAPVTES